MTRGCGVPYELTIFSLEDESGLMDVIDKGVCGANRSVVRAPMLVAGDRIDLLPCCWGNENGRTRIFT